MNAVIFYEKPGCLTNARQKTLLARCGCELTVKNLLTEPWTEAQLSSYLQPLPVAEWFNTSAPRIKSGDIQPGRLDADTAMALLLEDPLLIRRPLLDTPFGRMAGFDDADILGALGVAVAGAEPLPEGCSRPEGRPDCPGPE